MELNLKRGLLDDILIMKQLFFFLSVWQVLDRGEKIELLVDKTENLRSQVG